MPYAVLATLFCLLCAKTTTACKSTYNAYELFKAGGSKTYSENRTLYAQSMHVGSCVPHPHQPTGAAVTAGTALSLSGTECIAHQGPLSRFRYASFAALLIRADGWSMQGVQVELRALTGRDTVIVFGMHEAQVIRPQLTIATGSPLRISNRFDVPVNATIALRLPRPPTPLRAMRGISFIANDTACEGALWRRCAARVAFPTAIDALVILYAPVLRVNGSINIGAVTAECGCRCNLVEKYLLHTAPVPGLIGRCWQEEANVQYHVCVKNGSDWCTKERRAKFIRDGLKLVTGYVPCHAEEEEFAVFERIFAPARPNNKKYPSSHSTHRPMDGRPDRLRPPAGPVARLRGLPRAPRPSAQKEQGDASPLPWTDCFDEKIFVETDDARFAFYVAAFSNPTPGTPALLLLHGAGCTALSFAAFTKRLEGAITVLAPDMRGHGETTSVSQRQLSAQVLADDIRKAVVALYTARELPVPPLVVGGHSMGGGIAARIAASPSPLSVIACTLIDVVEGTALSALPSMAAWLAARPTSFTSCEAAVRYVVGRGLVRSLESARRSVPSQLVPDGTRWRWRTDLKKTQMCWEDWFKGLTTHFLGSEGPKLLILAGVDRLDRALTIAQMQGKFQQIFIPDAGHCIHEDQPEKTAKVFIDFLRRNLLAADGAAAVFQQRSLVVVRGGERNAEIDTVEE